MKIKLSANTWFLLGCIGIVAAFVLLPVLFGSKENYEVKNTMPVLPVENEVLMRGNEITREDLTEIIGRSNKKMTNQTTKKSFSSDSNRQQPKTQPISSTIGLNQSEQVSNPRINEKINQTKNNNKVIGYTNSGKPIVESDNAITIEHWSEMKRDGSQFQSKWKD